MILGALMLRTPATPKPPPPDEAFSSSALELQDTRHNDELFPLRAQLCFVFPAFFRIGGVESWFRALEPLFREGEFTLHAAAATQVYTPDTKQYFESLGALFNVRLSQMQQECDVMVITGHQPLARRSKAEKQVLGVHGGSLCAYTRRYAKHFRHYDYVVAVSNDSLSIILETAALALPFFNITRQSSVIPSTIIEQPVIADLSAYRVLDCKYQLLYLGRISPEKNPTLFSDVVEALPEGWCGIMVGPVYFKDAIPERKGKRVHVKPPTNEPQAYLRASTALFVSSFQEGGPIVVIESWFVGTPVFMFRTGLATQFPTALHVLPGVTMPATDIATYIVGHYQDRDVVARGSATYAKYFAPPVIMEKWRTVLRSVLADSSIARPLLVSERTGGEVFERGKTRHLICNEHIDFHATCQFGAALAYWNPTQTYRSLVIEIDAENIYYDVDISIFHNSRRIADNLQESMMGLPIASDMRYVVVAKGQHINLRPVSADEVQRARLTASNVATGMKQFTFLLPLDWKIPQLSWRIQGKAFALTLLAMYVK